MQKIIRQAIVGTTIITLLWSIIDNTFIPVCVNLSIVLLFAILTD